MLVCRVRVFRLSGTSTGADASPLLRWLPFVTDPSPVPRSVAAGRPAGIAGLPDRYVLVAGKIDGRKSIAHLLDWAAATRHEGLGLVLAGRVSAEVRTALDRGAETYGGLPANVTVVDRFILDEELVAVYAGATAVACLYENEGPGGAVTFAKLSGRPVIAWGSRQLAAQAGEAGLLVPCVDRTPVAIDAALDLALVLLAEAAAGPGGQAPAAVVAAAAEEAFAGPMLGVARPRRVGRS